MRRLILVCIVAIGVLAGLLSAAQDDWAMRAIMAGVGALFGFAIGGALTFLGRQKISSPAEIEDPVAGMGSSSKDLAANYWRDKGSPPLMKPSTNHPDKHMFDPDRLV